MEINLENKEKLFAQYWGLPIKNRNTSQFDGLPVGRNTLAEYCLAKSDYIELKPLSSITDEDAIIVGKMCHESICKGKPKTESNRKHRFNLAIKHFGDDGDYLLLYNTLYESVLDCRGGARISMNNYPIHVIDYLRSKGYALPWLSLSVDQMVEAGWIKLIEL